MKNASSQEQKLVKTAFYNLGLEYQYVTHSRIEPHCHHNHHNHPLHTTCSLSRLCSSLVNGTRNKENPTLDKENANSEEAGELNEQFTA